MLPTAPAVPASGELPAMTAVVDVSKGDEALRRCESSYTSRMRPFLGPASTATVSSLSVLQSLICSEALPLLLLLPCAPF
jgi:hypothetical protein